MHTCGSPGTVGKVQAQIKVALKVQFTWQTAQMHGDMYVQVLVHYISGHGKAEKKKKKKQGGKDSVLS